MKKILSILLCFPLVNCAQIKLSGTVTYFHNEYLGNKPDVGASVYIMDSSAHSGIDYNAIDSIIEGERRYSRYMEYKILADSINKMTSYVLVSKKRKEELKQKVPDILINNAKSYGVSTKAGYDSLDNNAINSTLRLKQYSKYSTKADGIGNYSMNIKKPGTYYILLQSVNRTGIGLNTIAGKIYLEKVYLEDGDEKNVSFNFGLY